jgi:hypothetical protein
MLIGNKICVSSPGWENTKLLFSVSSSVPQIAKNHGLPTSIPDLASPRVSNVLRNATKTPTAGKLNLIFGRSGFEMRHKEEIADLKSIVPGYIIEHNFTMSSKTRDHFQNSQL